MENNKLIKCAVLDDDHPAVRLIATYVKDTPGLELELRTTKVGVALSAVLAGTIDLLFLDIQMPEIRGLEFMQMIKETKTKVILTTAYKEYALHGFENDVIDYLMKPITFERFLVAAKKARERIGNTNGFANCEGHLMLKTEYRIQKTELSSILYIEGLGDYLIFFTTSAKIITLERMKNMEEILPSLHFLRIHRSFIINVNHINYLHKGKIIIGQKQLPVGETYKEKVKLFLGG